MSILPDPDQQLLRVNALRARGSLLPSSMLLVLANGVLLAGVLFFGWNAFDVILMYWMESAVIGVFTVLKLRKAGRKAPMASTMFMLHYGMFSLSMLMCIIGFFGPAGYHTKMTGYVWTAAMRHIFGEGMLDLGTALLSFAFSHGYSYRVNFLARKEYCDPKIVKHLIASPYIRLILTIFVILITNTMVNIFERTLNSGVIFLVVAKTVTDLFAHRREHLNRIPDAVPPGSITF